MKQLLPVALSVLIVACAPPKPGTEAHQRQLVEEARANFYAMKDEERRARGEAPLAREEEQQKQRPAKVRLKPFESAPAPARDTVFEKPAPAPAPKPTPAPELVRKPAPIKPVVMARATPALNLKKPAPAPKKPSLFAFGAPKTAIKPAPKPTPKPVVKPIAKAAPKPKTSLWAKTPPKRSDDTVYIFDMPQVKEPSSRRYQAYKAKYAASLGKSPEDLSRKEIEWARAHYRE